MQSQLVNSRNYSKSMDRLQHIFDSIAKDGFSDVVLQEIKNYTKDIQNGTEDFPRFNLSEHAGFSKGGAPLIGASIIACYATASLTASRNVEGREGYYSDGNTSVVKERTSIYSTWQKALDAIVLHNYLFPETAMKVIGFTRDGDGLMRIVLTQPYVNCLRLATKQEIDDMVAAKGFRDNWNGQGVNYISDRLALEDMHPANVFVDDVSGIPICIDCIVKFVK